eukprot:15270264-Alexandrium_andersonii.AAC.1
MGCLLPAPCPRCHMPAVVAVLVASFESRMLRRDTCSACGPCAYSPGCLSLTLPPHRVLTSSLRCSWRIQGRRQLRIQPLV